MRLQDLAEDVCWAHHGAYTPEYRLVESESLGASKFDGANLLSLLSTNDETGISVDDDECRNIQLHQSPPTTTAMRTPSSIDDYSRFPKDFLQSDRLNPNVG